MTAPGLGKSQIANRLRQAGAMLRLKGDNPYRARAYEMGADAVEALDEDLAALVEEQRLTDIPGIGPSLSATIGELVRTGSSVTLSRIMGDLPPGLLELAPVPGMTLRRMERLHETLDIGSLDDLRRALDAGAVEATKGFGPHTVARLREGLADIEQTPKDILLVDALEAAERILERLLRAPGVQDAAIVGSVRRCADVVADVNLLAASETPESVFEEFMAHSSVARRARRGSSWCEIRLFTGLSVTLEIVPPARFAAALALATSSRAHQRQLAARASARGVDLDGLVVEDEAAFYAALGLPPIPAELREGAGEIEAADAGDDFADVVSLSDIQGLIHCHTVYSDGRNTIEQMARAAHKMGMSYLTVTDHSPSATYARGVTLEDLQRQAAEIQAVRGHTPVNLLHGTETDILRDGALDHSGATLRALDVVIASVHERYRMDADAMTDRLARAMGHPIFKIWGHPLGRLLLRRDPIACDIERVLDLVAGAPAAIELNGSPYRLDLPAAHARAARRRGIKFVISTDAHSTGELHNLRFGVALARRAGLRRADVLNTLPAREFCAAVRPERARDATVP